MLVPFSFTRYSHVNSDDLCEMSPLHLVGKKIQLEGLVKSYSCDM